MCKTHSVHVVYEEQIKTLFTCEKYKICIGKGDKRRDFKEKVRKDTWKQELLGWLARYALHIVCSKTSIDVAECVLIGNHLDGGGHLKHAIAGGISPGLLVALHYCPD